jgi:hypothetical protein
MSTTAVSMRELELEGAELLPSRETLWCGGNAHSGTSFTYVFSQVGNGNTAQSGLINLAALNGDFNNLTIL